MNRQYCLTALGLFAALTGCSNEQAAGPPTSEPVTPISRVYTSLPAEILVSPKWPSVHSPTVPKLERALATADLDQAFEIYHQIVATTPDAPNLLARAGLQLVAGYMRSEPRRIKQAAMVLEEVNAIIRHADIATAVHEDSAWWNLVLHVYNTGRSMLGDETSSKAWSDQASALMHQIRHRPRSASELVDAIDWLVSSMAGTEALPPGLLEIIMVDLQCGLPWPTLLVPIQHRRVKLLLETGQHEAALFEFRVLWALSAQDAGALFQAAKLANDVRTATHLGQSARKERRLSADASLTALVESLAEAQRNQPYLVSKLAALRTETPPSAHAQIRTAFVALLAGRFPESIDRFNRLIRIVETLTDDDRSRVLDGMAMARAGKDGHPFDCDRFAPRLLTGIDAWESASPVWRYEAMRFLDRRIALIRVLIDNQQADLALRLCTTIANRWTSPTRGGRALDLALGACQAGVYGQSEPTAHKRYMEFGRTLKHPEAKAGRARRAAKAYMEADFVAEALAELEPADLTTAEPMDPEFAFLYAYCLLRSGRTAEALPRLEHLAERPDLTRDSAAQAHLLIGAIHLRQGELIDARQALQRVIRRDPGGSFAARARQILDRI